MVIDISHKSAPSECPVGKVWLRLLYFGCGALEVVDGNFIRRLSWEKLRKDLLGPLLVLNACCCMPAVQAIELYNIIRL